MLESKEKQSMNETDPARDRVLTGQIATLQDQRDTLIAQRDELAEVKWLPLLGRSVNRCVGTLASTGHLLECW